MVKGVQEIDKIAAEILTAGGLQGVALLPLDLISDIVRLVSSDSQ